MNGDLKRLRGLTAGIYRSLFRDLCIAHPLLSKELTRDLQTVENRLEHEGIAFMTKTLPLLGAAILAGLQEGKLTLPSAFAKRKQSALPRLLGGLLRFVFDEEGVLVDPDSLVIAELLQVTELGKKLSLPYSKEAEDKVINQFLDTETDLAALDIKDDMVIDRARATITRLFADFDPYDIIPRHGPGSTATGERFERKWHFSRHYAQIHSAYPYYTYFVASRGSFLQVRQVKDYRVRDRMLSGEARVCLVDKDSRGPRLISLEPLEYQYIQQGLGRAIMARLETHPLSSGRVNFTDQSINRNAALQGSLTGTLATLDMKEASDRVSLQLVEKLFRDVPDLLKCLLATRTPRTVLPDGRTVCMKKFAPMGSALCFPIESVVFFALCKAIIETNGCSADQLRVYGDDLIVPNDVALSVMDRLPKYGLKVNTAKSFTNGPFRESCGMDAVKGVQVTPARWRKPWPKSIWDGKQIAALVDFANRLYCAGFWSTCSYLERKLLRLIPNLPAVGLANHTGALGFVRVTAETAGPLAMLKKGVSARWNSNLQRLEVQVFMCEPKTRKSVLNGVPRLHANLVEQYTSSHAVSHAATKLKRRWLCAHALVNN